MLLSMTLPEPLESPPSPEVGAGAGGEARARRVDEEAWDNTDGCGDRGGGCGGGGGGGALYFNDLIPSPAPGGK